MKRKFREFRESDKSLEHSLLAIIDKYGIPISLIVSNIAGGVNEHNSIVKKCLCTWLDSRKDDHSK